MRRARSHSDRFVVGGAGVVAAACRREGGEESSSRDIEWPRIETGTLGAVLRRSDQVVVAEIDEASGDSHARQ